VGQTPGSGEPAPPFELPAAGGSRVSLEDFRGRWLALFFFPKASTPG
jgi:peroxiredoxin Q/BCP